MQRLSHVNRIGSVIAAALYLTACQAVENTQTTPEIAAAEAAAIAQSEVQFEADRTAILAMEGNFKVSFDFIETVSFVDDYEPKDPYESGAHEVVRVIEDRGDFISLQHILVVGGPDQKFPVKHWRQDWQYEPEEVLVFIGGNAWEIKDVPEAERAGKWSQTVYQVDDSPRYGAVGGWSHVNGVSEWVPPAEWRPLPRRDMTKRDDYHAILAVNRHAITPDGWVHEQDNSKLVLSGDTPQTLVREIGYNTYRRSDDFQVDIAETYWNGTVDYWTAVREEWTRMEKELPAFALTLQGEPEQLYFGLLGLAEGLLAEEITLDDSIADAKEVIATYTTAELGDLQGRLREPTDDVEVAANAQ